MAKRIGAPSHELTMDDAVEIWFHHWKGEIQSRIAARFDVNQGRICEVLKGKRLSGSEQLALRRRAA